MLSNTKRCRYVQFTHKKYDVKISKLMNSYKLLKFKIYPLREHLDRLSVFDKGEIEEVIYTHTAVKTVCVVGVDDDNFGEVPLACVIVKNGHSVSEEEIINLVEGV